MIDYPKINAQIEETGIAGDMFWSLGSTFNGGLYPSDGYLLHANDSGRSIGAYF